MPEAGLIISRFLHYGAVLLLFGAALFPLYAYRNKTSALQADQQYLLRQLKSVLLLLASLGLLSGTSWFFFTAGSMTGDPASMADPAILKVIVQATDFGRLWVARLACIIVIALLLVRWPASPYKYLVPLFAAALLASLGGTGHAQSSDGGVLHVLADGVHLTAAGFWLGGLLPLGIVALATARTQREADVLMLGETLHNFSGIATLAVAMLVVSGLLNGWYLVGSLHALISTTYGRLLLIKLGLFLLMVLVALTNRFWITPELQRGGPSSISLLRRLRWHIAAEQALGLLVLAVVSLLGLLEP